MVANLPENGSGMAAAKSMTSQQQRITIGVGIAALIIGIAAVLYLVMGWPAQQNRPPAPRSGEQARHPDERPGRNRPEPWDEDSARLRFHQLTRMADEVGIDTTVYAFAFVPADSANPKTAWKRVLTALLLELRYGHRPARQRYAGLPETPDTTGLQAALTEDTDQAGFLKTNIFLPYARLVAAFGQQRRAGLPADSLRAIRQTLNFYRYISRFNADRLVVINLPAAELTVFDSTGARLLVMAAIVGKKSKRTPMFTAWLNQITMYPYWNVPRGIGIQEILPKARASSGYLDRQNMEVLNSRDQPVDPTSLDWNGFSARNFPYRFRQASGCSNSLGLLKFTLSCPFDIYLHDTNARDLFVNSTNRWRSHGCIRLENPVDFANLILNKPMFDAAFMNRCLIEQKPKIIPVPAPLPVVIAYNTADMDANGRLVFYADVYGLAK
jgi:L,D-transpeptidase YcbB